jgi:hypothetical protein
MTSLVRNSGTGGVCITSNTRPKKTKGPVPVMVSPQEFDALIVFKSVFISFLPFSETGDILIFDCLLVAFPACVRGCPLLRVDAYRGWQGKHFPV